MDTPDPHNPRFRKLVAFLSKVPAIEVNDTPSRGFGSGSSNGIWWIKFQIRIEHVLAWRAVQELGYALNNLSISAILPTTFKPVSPPPYLNGGPSEYLSWVIECPDKAMEPSLVAEWLEGRLPRPVENDASWPIED